MAARGLSQVRRRVAAAAARVDRDPDNVTLVAVTKGHTIEAIRAAYDDGQRHFGENRSEELAAKAPELPDDIVWHMVGTVQRRKAALAAAHADLVHSLDRESLLRRWATLDDPSPGLLQLNLANEAQKHGAALADTEALLELATGLGVSISGLMIMPPQVVAAEENRVWFRRLRELRDSLQGRFPGLEHLSMGMTDDFEVAVEEGATLLRVGRAIFERGPPGHNPG